MTDEQIELARRAVACRGWRWMRGMSNNKGQTIDCVFEDIGTAYCGEIDADMNALPDLTDPATLGCLLALVREAMGDHRICVCWDFVNEMWVCEGAFEYNGNKYLGLIKEAQSYAEALVLTLEDAP